MPSPLAISKDQLERLYNDQRLSSPQIAKIVGASVAGIGGLLRKYSLSRNRSEACQIAQGKRRLDLPKELLEQLYWIERLSIPQIAKRLGVNDRTIWMRFQLYQIPVRTPSESHKLGSKKGSEHYAWKGGRCHTGDYICVLSPEHPRANRLGYVLEHILIWEETHGKPLPKGWAVHHLNGIKSDNSPQNLAGLPSKKHAHVLIAKAKRIRELEIENRQLRRVLESHQGLFIIEN